MRYDPLIPQDVVVRDVGYRSILWFCTAERIFGPLSGPLSERARARFSGEGSAVNRVCEQELDAGLTHRKRACGTDSIHWSTRRRPRRITVSALDRRPHSHRSLCARWPWRSSIVGGQAGGEREAKARPEGRSSVRGSDPMSPDSVNRLDSGSFGPDVAIGRLDVAPVDARVRARTRPRRRSARAGGLGARTSCSDRPPSCRAGRSRSP
jgi:hypothetical protein